VRVLNGTDRTPAVETGIAAVGAFYQFQPTIDPHSHDYVQTHY